MSTSRVKFYWESLGEHYRFSPDKQYLIYYRGCFCPPHRGHFNTIADFTYLPNAKFFIHQGGRQKRHGVPYELSRKIWKIYINELLPSDRFILMGRGSNQANDMADHPFTQEADTIVFIAGNENYDPKEKEMEDRKYGYAEIFNKLLMRNKEIIFLYLDRPQQNILSATQLSSNIQANRHYSFRDGRKYQILRPFFPENLSNASVRYITRKLEECDLH
jgi:hypothetical protein